MVQAQAGIDQRQTGKVLNWEDLIILFFFCITLFYLFFLIPSLQHTFLCPNGLKLL